MRNQPIHEFIEVLHTSLDGLSSAEAERRLAEFGSNTLVEEKHGSQLLKFLGGFTHFFAIILWIGAGLAFFAEWKAPGGGMHFLGWAIVGVIVINAIFSYWQEFKAEQAIAALKKLIPHSVKVFRDGKLQQLGAATLVPGDLISLEEGDDVPADCRLVEAFSLRANYATLTGESMPLARTAIDCPGEDRLHDKNTLLAGTSVFAGKGKAIVFATGMHTEFGKIAHLTQSTNHTLSPLQLEIVRLSRVIAAIAVSVGLLFFFVGKAMGISFWANIIFALGIIVALVPEGLLPEVTLALASCSQRMAKRNALVRHLPAVETLGCATVICTDKTGTLTENKMWVSESFLCGQFLGNLESRTIHDELAPALAEFCTVALNCENTKEAMKDGKLCLIGDPMEIALVEFARTSIEPSKSVRVDEMPFDTDRKRISVIYKDEQGNNTLYLKGALEPILPLCRFILTKDGEKPFDDVQCNAIVRAQEKMTKRGLRVLALCRRNLPADYEREYAESQLTILGLIGFEDPPRKEVPDAIARCKTAGIRVIMITGDHPNTAEAIARQVGLIESEHPSVIVGAELRKMSDTQLQMILSRREVIFARTDADQKMRIVLALKRSGQIVAVTGDGVNDAPALKAADIGIAMGLTGTDVAREAAVMVLADDNFSSIVNAIEEGRGVFANIRKFLSYVLSSNIAELIPCLAFVIFRIPLPLTVMQVLSIDLGTDLLPALALGTERPDPFVMSMPPRDRKSGLFDWKLLSRAYLYLGLMVSVSSMAGFFYMLHAQGWHWGTLMATEDPHYRIATTACLMGIMCMQIVNSSICRSERKSIFSIGVFSNRLLNLGVFAEILLMMFITYSAAGQLIFHTGPLPLQFWIYMLPFMLLMFLIEETRKYIVRRRSDSSPTQTPTVNGLTDGPLPA